MTQRRLEGGTPFSSSHRMPSMPVLPKPTTVQAAWGAVCNWFGGTQRTPGATAYLGGRVDSAAVCAWVASTTFLRTVICRLLPLVSERTWCLSSRADGIFRHRKPVHAAGGEKALLHHLVEVG
jgi:hypothetical protein